MLGWQTWVSVIGAIAGGVVSICGGLLATPMDWVLIGAGITAILAALGIGTTGKKLGTMHKQLTARKLLSILFCILLAGCLLSSVAYAGDRSFSGLFVESVEKKTVEPSPPPALRSIFGATLPINLTGDTLFRARTGSVDLGLGIDLASYKDMIFLRAEVTEALDPNEVFAGAGLTVNIPALVNMLTGASWKATYINPSIGVIPGWDFKEHRFDVGVLLSIIQVTF